MAINISPLSKTGPDFPGRLLNRRPRPIVCCFLMLSISILFLSGCAFTKNILATLPLSGQDPDSIEENYFLVQENQDVIGQLATIRLKRGDTLPDIARHFSLGFNTVSAANPGVDAWVPGAGECIVLPLSFILPDADRKGIVINLAAMRLFSFKREDHLLAVATYPVGVGTAERPTPRGRMVITRKKFQPIWYVPASIAADHRKKGDPLPAAVPPGPLNPLGEYALYLSKPEYLVHGTNKPASIGLRATNGCIRLYPEDIKQLFDITPVKTPVTIVNQPYLIGQRDGMVYLEAHRPFKESGTPEMERVYAKLRQLEKDTGLMLDWSRVETVLAEVRGIPVAVSRLGRSGSRPAGVNTVILRHPGKLNGQPTTPELKTDAWYVLAANMGDKVEALRLAAILNHQGPQIPAQVLSKRGRHRVLAGPFDNEKEASHMSKRMQIDLGIEGVLVEPVQAAANL